MTLARPMFPPRVGARAAPGAISSRIASQERKRQKALRDLARLRKEASAEIDRLIAFLDASDPYATTELEVQVDDGPIDDEELEPSFGGVTAAGLALPCGLSGGELEVDYGNASAPPGAVQLSPPCPDSGTPSTACQTDRDPIEPPHVGSTSMPCAGGAVLSRRSLMNKIVAVSAIAAAVPVAAVAMPAGLVAAAAPAPTNADAALFELEEQIFEAYEAATENRKEIERLEAIWRAEGERLYDEVHVHGRSELTSDQRMAVVCAMPESKESNRLIKLSDLHFKQMDELIKRMWTIPATTPEGRLAKLSVLLTCIMGPEWNVCGDDADYDIKMARDLMIDFIGGEPAEQLRNQFS